MMAYTRISKAQHDIYFESDHLFIFCKKLSCALYDIWQHSLFTKIPRALPVLDCDNQNVSKTLSNILWQAKLQPVENHCLLCFSEQYSWARIVSGTL